MTRIDRSKLIIKKKGFRFAPFRPAGDRGIGLNRAGLGPEIELIAFERGGQRRALLVREMFYHHVCQGELAGEPYLVTF